MEKFDPIKMAELVSVKEDEGGLTLVFQGDKSVRVTVSDGSLVSEVTEGTAATDGPP